MIVHQHLSEAYVELHTHIRQVAIPQKYLDGSISNMFWKARAPQRRLLCYLMSTSVCRSGVQSFSFGNNRMHFFTVFYLL